MGTTSSQLNYTLINTYIFSLPLTDLDRSQDVQTSSIDCGGRETWQHGNSLVNYMKMVSSLFHLKNIFIYTNG